MSAELKVYTKKETQKLLGLSGRTWDRLEALGRTPPKTRLSPNRIGYRVPISPHGSTRAAKCNPPAS